MKKAVVFALIFLIAISFVWFFYLNSLNYKIKQVIKNKDCTVSAAVINKNKRWIVNDKKTPLMSVFKYFIAVFVLEKIEKENISLEDKILVKESDVIKNTYTPMLEKYKNFPFEISFKDLMRYMVSESDNNATDILLNYIGGLSNLQEYLNNMGFSDIKISADEKMMEDDIQNQYLNVASPLSVIKFMKFVREVNVLSDNSKQFLDKTMVETITGLDKLKAGLPEGVILGHKTGMSSRKANGIRIAENDAGFVNLSNGETYYIAVFVSESKMSDKENTALIVQISKIVYEYFTKSK